MIYCVEDDSSIRELELYTLKTAGFEGAGFTDSQKFWQVIEKELPELILLDIMLPGEDGITILKKLRSNYRTEKVPVIMTTAKGTEYDKVIGLDLGADDYLAKPFGMMEMISRVKAVLRRSNPRQKDNVIHYGVLEIDRNKHVVKVDGVLVELTRKEFNILLLFVENSGQVMARDDLLNKIWGTDYMGESRTVDMHISTLRTKLGKYGNTIKTIRGFGYRMDENFS